MSKPYISFSVNAPNMEYKLRRIENGIQKKVELAWIRVRRISAAHILQQTPVLTGFLRNQWTTGIRATSGRYVPTSERTPASIAALQFKITDGQFPTGAEIETVLAPTKGLKPFKSFWFVLNVQYAQRAKYNSRRKHYDQKAIGKIEAQIQSELGGR